MNIILICADTLRADYLGCYGNDWIHTPRLDALSANSIVFDRYHAASFPTMPNRADVFTGRWTYTYTGWQPLANEEILLAELLRADGMKTLAAVDTPFFIGKGYNYDRGFDEFIRVPGQAVDERARLASLRRFEEDCCACATMIEAGRLLEHYRKEHFFLYVDTWDPHEPWNPPPWYVERYLPRYDGRMVAPCYARYQDHGLTEDDLKVARATYAAEVSMVDRWIGYLLDKLESLNLADTTAVIFMSDHGFYFGEHGGLFGKLVGSGGTFGSVEKAASVTRTWFRSPLYEQLTRVPLMMRIPGIAPCRTAGLTSAVDVMPTVLELAGVPAPDAVHGHSVLAAQDRSWPGRDVVYTSTPLLSLYEPTRLVDDFIRGVSEYQPVSIREKRWNLHYAAAGEAVELFDLESDPGQQCNVAVEHGDVVERLHGRFVEHLRECPTHEQHLRERERL